MYRLTINKINNDISMISIFYNDILLEEYTYNDNRTDSDYISFNSIWIQRELERAYELGVNKGKNIIDFMTKVRDQVSTFEGYVTARTEYMNGNVSYCVEPDKLTSDGIPVTYQWIDGGRLEEIKDDCKVGFKIEKVE